MHHISRMQPPAITGCHDPSATCPRAEDAAPPLRRIPPHYRPYPLLGIPPRGVGHLSPNTHGESTHNERKGEGAGHRGFDVASVSNLHRLPHCEATKVACSFPTVKQTRWWSDQCPVSPSPPLVLFESYFLLSRRMVQGLPLLPTARDPTAQAPQQTPRRKPAPTPPASLGPAHRPGLLAPAPRDPPAGAPLGSCHQQRKLLVIFPLLCLSFFSV